MPTSFTDAQLAAATRLKHLKSLAQRTKAVTDDLQQQINTLDGGAIKEVQVNGTALTPSSGAVNVTVAVEKKTTANTGYAASYTVKANGVALSPDIDIPKDFLVKSASMAICQTADTPIAGLAVGDPYLDFVVNTVDSSETAQHIYVNVADLVDVYTASNGIDITSNAISVVVDSSNANGLSVGANGVALAVATDSAAGAMSATDHAQFTADSTKLAAISAQANKTTVTTAKSGVIEIDGTSYTVVEFAADTDVANMIDDELPAPAGA